MVVFGGIVTNHAMAKLEIPSIVVQHGVVELEGPSCVRKQSWLYAGSREEESMSGQSGNSGEDEVLSGVCGESSASINGRNGVEPQIQISQEVYGDEFYNPEDGTESPPRAESPEDHSISPRKNSSKMKLLVRSHAIREATSPPPDPSRSTPSPRPLTSGETDVTVESDHGGYDNHHCEALDSDPDPGFLSPPPRGCFQGSARSNGKGCNASNTLGVSGSTSNKITVTTQTCTRHMSRLRLKQGSSSQGSMESTASCVSFSLSRDSSTEQVYMDSTGVDLEHFIVDTLHRNHKDRMALLKMESEMVQLIRDNKRTYHKFPPMSSYHRMLVHRVAAFLGLDHNVDQTGNAVVVNKTRHTRLPDVRFREYIRDKDGTKDECFLCPANPGEEPRKSILKRESSSFDDNYKSPERQFSSDSRGNKSFEEREEEYEKVKQRIFNPQSWSSMEGAPECGYDSPHRGSQDQEDLAWPWSSTDSDPVRNREKPTTSRKSQHTARPLRLLKVESFDGRELLCGQSGVRPTVAKSYSFGGYTAMAAGPPEPQPYSQQHQGHHVSPRFLAKQDSGASYTSMSRLSPSSSGYKSQSQQSDSAGVSAATSPTPVIQNHPSARRPTEFTNEVPDWGGGKFKPNVPVPVSIAEGLFSGPALLWAVSSMDAVPPGSVLINPQTGEPYLNPDGSVYRYEPRQPLPFTLPIPPPPPTHEKAMEENYPPLSQPSVPMEQLLPPPNMSENATAWPPSNVCWLPAQNPAEASANTALNMSSENGRQTPIPGALGGVKTVALALGPQGYVLCHAYLPGQEETTPQLATGVPVDWKGPVLLRPVSAPLPASMPVYTQFDGGNQDSEQRPDLTASYPGSRLPTPTPLSNVFYSYNVPAQLQNSQPWLIPAYGNPTELKGTSPTSNPPALVRPVMYPAPQGFPFASSFMNNYPGNYHTMLARPPSPFVAPRAPPTSAPPTYVASVHVQHGSYPPYSNNQGTNPYSLATYPQHYFVQGTPPGSRGRTPDRDRKFTPSKPV